MNKILISLLIVGALFIFILGGGLGVLYQAQKGAPQVEKSQTIEKSQTTESIVKALSSKLVASLSFYGQVTNIKGRNVTLTHAGDSFTVRIKDDAVVYATNYPQGLGVAVTGLRQQQVEFKDIKNGDSLTIGLKLLPNGQLEGQSVIIVPVFETTTPINNIK